MDFFSSQQIVDAMSLTLTDKTYAHGLRRAAMQTVQQRYSLNDGIKRYAELILNRPVHMAYEMQTSNHQAPTQIILSNSENGLVDGNGHRHLQNNQPESSIKLSKFARRASDKLIQYELTQIGITQRELEILKCLSLGMEDKSISTQLQISIKTVSAHVSSIINKLGANNRTHAVAKVFHSSMLNEANQAQKPAIR